MEILHPPVEIKEPQQTSIPSPLFLPRHHDLVDFEQQTDGFPIQFILPDFEVDSQEKIDRKEELSDANRVSLEERSWQIPMDITDVEYRAVELAYGISSTLSEIRAGSNLDEEQRLDRFKIFRSQVRAVPAYTVKRDDKGKEVNVPNRAKGLLTDVYSDYLQETQDEAMIKGYLVKEKKLFDERWKE